MWTTIALPQNVQANRFYGFQHTDLQAHIHAFTHTHTTTRELMHAVNIFPFSIAYQSCYKKVLVENLQELKQFFSLLSIKILKEKQTPYKDDILITIRQIAE